MKINVLNLLRGGVFSMALVAAFAFTSPSGVVQYGQDPNTGIWYDLTDQNPAPDTYSCETQPSSNCRVDSPDEFGMPINPSDNGKELNVIDASKLTEV
ncbi:hypothetical protein [Algoriphagus pacificus]|uniref:Uncharacterized protein n=1 Tax=Algoriphagus pacificus TaxID=2811234 RepID=A0ABS3CGM8_9BACT|nr:hypothetical protein [Algoriphagus pacificus]MBN7816260.1 hypothetical protein [Algoriphagus pacificus]